MRSQSQTENNILMITINTRRCCSYLGIQFLIRYEGEATGSCCWEEEFSTISTTTQRCLLSPEHDVVAAHQTIPHAPGLGGAQPHLAQVVLDAAVPGPPLDADVQLGVGGVDTIQEIRRYQLTNPEHIRKY